MDLNNPALQESFASKMRRIQQEQKQTVNPEVVETAFENIKKAIEKFVENPNNCFSSGITFKIREVKPGLLELYDEMDPTSSIAKLSMSELCILDNRISLKESGLSTSGSFGNNGHLTVRWR
jgi:hypothetical protein